MDKSDDKGFKWESRFTSLRKWRLGSFKSIAKSVEIDLAPLTVVVGANSSGKSTLIQSILMMAQNSLRSDEKSPPKTQGIFELNGPLVQLGTMKETCCDLLPIKKYLIEVGGEWFAGEKNILMRDSDEAITGSARVGEQSLEWNVNLSPVNKMIDSGLAVLQNSSAKYFKRGILQGECTVNLSKAKNVDLIKSKYELFSFSHSAKSLDHIEATAELDQTNSSRLHAVSFQVGLPTTGLVKKNVVKYLFDSQSKVLEEAMIIGAVGMDPDLTEQEIEENRYVAYVPFIDDFVKAFADVGKKIVQQDLSSEDRNVAKWSSSIEQFPLIPFDKFPKTITQFFNDGDGFGNKISEVESNFHWQIMRDLRKRFDELFGDAEWTRSSIYCGPNGRRSANPTISSENSPLTQLIRRWNKYLSEKVLYLGPLRVGPRASYGIGSSIENFNLPLGESGEFLAKKLFNDRDSRLYPVVDEDQVKDAMLTLEEAVTHWYQYLSSSAEQNKIDVDAPNRQGYPLKIGSRTLANVGFGASQILPVLGICLSAKPGDLILLEQPELHLNPGMQQKLADFLLLMSRTGRQIIVETHSEYLITRLRRNAASNPDDHKFFTIIYVERDPKMGTSYRTVSVDDQGDLSEWPKGFFDHVAEDLRVLMRRAAERQSGKV